MGAMTGPSDAGDWLSLTDTPIDHEAVASWVADPSCGAVVTFAGTARDHSDGRTGVEQLAYEAYEDVVVPRLQAVATELRRRWPDVRRVALIHRVGELQVGDLAVVVATSAPHRRAAFESASFGIDAVKASVPIWKRERWADGESWGLEAQHLVEPAAVDALGTP